MAATGSTQESHRILPTRAELRQRMHWQELAIGVGLAVAGFALIATALTLVAFGLMSVVGATSAISTADGVVTITGGLASFVALYLAVGFVDHRVTCDRLLHGLLLFVGYAAVIVAVLLADVALGFPLEAVVRQGFLTSFGIVQYVAFAALVGGFAAVMIAPSQIPTRDVPLNAPHTHDEDDEQGI